MKAQIQEDMKAAMKAKDTLLLNTVRGLLSEIKRAEIDSRTELNEEQCIATVQKEVKKRRDAIDFAKTANRTDLIEQNETEIKILQKYLGEQLTEEKLAELISQLISGGADNLGKIMGGLNKDHKGKFDGRVASDLAKKALG